MEQTRMIELLERHIAGTLPESEWQELLTGAGGPNGEATVRQVLESLLEQMPEGLPYDAARFDPILRQALASDIPIRQQPSLRRVPLSRRLAAAAAILALLAVGWWLLLRNRPSVVPQLSQAERFKNDIAPGHQAAILTLAGGRSILLDSAHNGPLARQAGTQIIKSDSGNLVYQAKNIRSGWKETFNTLSTPRGGQYRLILPDGSKVWLNAASSLRFPTNFSGKERIVELTGEAYFEVARDAARPFRVQSGGLNIAVLGTSFDVMAYADEPTVKTTLIEGVVKVNETLLQPGERSVAANGKIKVEREVNTGDDIAWKDGQFRFNSVDIASILRQAARWYDVEIVYDGKVEDTFSGGVSRSVNISGLLRILELTGKLTFEIDGKKITVKPVHAK